MNAIGAKTATSTSVIAKAAPPSSLRPAKAASLVFEAASRIARRLLSMMTIESSTRMPIVSESPIKREHVDRKARDPHRDERRAERDGNRDCRDKGVAPRVQEQNHHQNGEHDPFSETLQHAADRSRRVGCLGAKRLEANQRVASRQIR